MPSGLVVHIFVSKFDIWEQNFKIHVWDFAPTCFLVELRKRLQ